MTQSDQTAQPQSAEELAEIGRRHVWNMHAGIEECVTCGEGWPCDALRLLDAAREDDPEDDPEAWRMRTVKPSLARDSDLALLRDTPHRDRLRRVMDRVAPFGMLRTELIDAVFDIEASALATHPPIGAGQSCVFEERYEEHMRVVHSERGS